MKSTVLKLIALLAVLLPFSASALDIVASKNYVTKKVSVPSFTAVNTVSSIDIEVIQGKQNVEVYAPDNLINYIKVSVNGGKLEVKFTEKNISIRGSHKTVVKVSAPVLNRLSTNASGDIFIKSSIVSNASVTLITNASGDIKGGDISAPECQIGTNGSGDIELGTITAPICRLNTNASGDIDVKGVVAKNRLECGTNGSGDIDAVMAKTDNLSVSINGSGDIDIKNVIAAGVTCRTDASGDVTLAGVCNNAEYCTGGSGSIMAKGLKAKNVVASTMGSGDIDCFSEESLKATKKGSGDISYRGNPSKIDFRPRRGLHHID